MARRTPAVGDTVVVAILAIVGALNVLPGLGLLGAAQIQSLYGIQALDSTETILMRHRALLLALLGALLLASIWLTALRVPVLIAALVSKVVFLLLVLTAPHTPEVARVALIDTVALVLLCVALWLSVSRRRASASS